MAVCDISSALDKIGFHNTMPVCTGDVYLSPTNKMCLKYVRTEMMQQPATISRNFTFY